METTIIKPSLSYLYKEHIKIHEALSQNFVLTLTDHLNELHRKYPSFKNLGFITHSEYSEDHDANFSPYIETVTYNLTADQFYPDCESIIETVNNRKYDSSTMGYFPNAFFLNYHSQNQTIIDETLKEELAYIVKMISNFYILNIIDSVLGSNVTVIYDAENSEISVDTW
jgi:hypothetical protein